MTTFDRYLLRRMAAALAKILVTFLAIFLLVDFVAARIADMLMYDVPPGVVAAYYLYLIPFVLNQAAPLAMLVAGLMVLGQAAQDNEVTAMLAAGVPLRRLVRMPVVLAAGAAVGLFAMQETIGATATDRAESINDRYFSTSGVRQRPPIAWANLEGGWTCIAGKFNRIALTGENISISRHTASTGEQIIARRMFWEPAVQQWLLEDGVWVVLDTQRNVRESLRRISQVPAPIAEPPERLFALDEAPERKTAAELRADIAYAAARGMPTDAYAVDYHVKFSWPALCFVMISLAIPFALRLRKGGVAISFGTSIAIALAYLAVFGVCVIFGHAERIPPVAAAWLANCVFLALGLVMFQRSPT